MRLHQINSRIHVGFWRIVDILFLQEVPDSLSYFIFISITAIFWLGMHKYHFLVLIEFMHFYVQGDLFSSLQPISYWCVISMTNTQMSSILSCYQFRHFLLATGIGTSTSSPYLKCKENFILFFFFKKKDSRVDGSLNSTIPTSSI